MTASPLAPHLDPSLNQRLVTAVARTAQQCAGTGSIKPVLAIAHGQGGALGRQSSPPGGGLLEFGDRGGVLFGG